MNKFTPEEVDAAASETESFRVYCGDFNVADMLRAFAARLREDDENAKDAALWRYVVAENNKGMRGSFRIVWPDPTIDGLCTTDGVSCDGKDDEAIVRVVSAAMREQGDWAAQDDGSHAHQDCADIEHALSLVSALRVNAPLLRNAGMPDTCDILNKVIFDLRCMLEERK